MPSLPYRRKFTFRFVSRLGTGGVQTVDIYDYTGANAELKLKDLHPGATNITLVPSSHDHG